ncbi:MAG: biotin/lipoyl-binding protein [Gammaproteobacteria bacterium AqS3]|nr:biotin/lipoyl-binding protein [Gammaproteobacteria bacterium AqS3]
MSALIDQETEVNGRVWKLKVAPGDAVAAGDVLMILESMKMEIPVEATASGVVSEVLVGEGDEVADGDIVVRLTAS